MQPDNPETQVPAPDAAPTPTAPIEPSTPTPPSTPEAVPPAVSPAPAGKSSKKKLMVIALVVVALLAVGAYAMTMKKDDDKDSASTTPETTESVKAEDTFNITYASYGAAGDFDKMYDELVSSSFKAAVPETRFVSGYTPVKPCLVELDKYLDKGIVLQDYTTTSGGARKYTYESDVTTQYTSGDEKTQKCTLSWYIKQDSAGKWELVAPPGA